MADKKTHFGRAGEYFAMSELLLRGWNVAGPVVDVGDDVFVIDDNDKTTWRLQVKAADGEAVPEADGGGVKAKFTLSRAQLRTAQPIELFFMLVIRHAAKWRFLIVPRLDLFKLRDAYVEAGKTREGRGRRPVGDEAAKTDALGLEVVLKGAEAEGWEASLTPFLDRWPDDLAPVPTGPGAVGQAVQGAAAEAGGAAPPAEGGAPPPPDAPGAAPTPPEEGPVQSQDRER
jgi:hypothetical protein